MKMETKATSDGIGYASKTSYEWEGKNFEPDLQDGDTVTILNSGSIEEGNYGSQHYFKIMTRNGEKKAPFNQSSVNVLVGALGEESEDWANKQVKVLLKKGVYAGKKGIACYFVVEGWYLDDFGDLTNDTPNPVGVTANTGSADPVPQGVEDAYNTPVEEPKV